MTPVTPQPLQPKVILGVAAHPDDLDFGASGAIAKWVREGAEAYYLILTDGGKGSSDRSLSSAALTNIRRDEQKVAGECLGLKDVFFLDYPDGELQVTMDLKRHIARFIRRLRPDVVVTMDPGMLYVPEIGFINHPDHRAAGQATLDAVFPLARDHLTFPELLREGLEPHKTSTVLLINLREGLQNYAVDISSTLDCKMKALAAHASQINDGTQAMMTDVAARTGAHHGCAYAEGFVRIDVQ